MRGRNKRIMSSEKKKINGMLVAVVGKGNNRGKI